MFKIVKSKELDELKQNYNDVADIVYTYGLFHDVNQNLEGDENFNSEFVEKKWDKFYKLDSSIRTYLVDETSESFLEYSIKVVVIPMFIGFCIGSLIIPLL